MVTGYWEVERYVGCGNRGIAWVRQDGRMSSDEGAELDKT